MSTLARQSSTPMTIAEFDAFVETRLDDHTYELVDGEVVMMTNPNRRHERITSSIGARLTLAMDARGCRTYQGGMRVHLSDNMTETDKVRPDVVVQCGKKDRKEDLLNYITDPLVIVEVLSPSTMDVDRGAKLDFYKSLPTLQHIAIVYQDQLRIEHYRRRPEGWVCDVLTKGTDILHLEAVAFRMPVAQAYFDVEF